jgi:hypothetical protein
MVSKRPRGPASKWKNEAVSEPTKPVIREEALKPLPGQMGLFESEGSEDNRDSTAPEDGK